MILWYAVDSIFVDLCLFLLIDAWDIELEPVLEDELYGYCDIDYLQSGLWTSSPRTNVSGAAENV